MRKKKSDLGDLVAAEPMGWLAIVHKYLQVWWTSAAYRNDPEESSFLGKYVFLMAEENVWDDTTAS